MINVLKINCGFALIDTETLCWVGLVVSVSASHAINHGFAPLLSHIKDPNKKGTCLPAWQASLRVGVLLDCIKGRVVCGTVYGKMHLKDLLGSIARVGYHIPVPDFYLVLHDLRRRKSTIMD